MKGVIRVLVLGWIACALTAVLADTPQSVIIEGEYIVVDQLERADVNGKGLLDPAELTVTVTREELGKNDEIEVIELASGSFEDGRVSLEIEVEESIEAQVSVMAGEVEIKSSDILIVPSEESISFAFVDRDALDSDQLLLVGIASQVRDPSKKFSISGVYDLQDGQSAPGYLSASLASFEYLKNGTPLLIDFGTVLLQNDRYLIEAEVEEPRVCKLTISRGVEYVWSTSLVIEPNAKIDIARRGPANTLIATAENGRHAKLIDSWHMNEEFLAKGQDLVSAPVSERQTRFEELMKIRIKALEDLAWNSKDPFDSLLALELTYAFYGGDGGLIDKHDKVRQYDKLATILDEDVVARRITPLRDQLVADIARFDNSENLSIGKEAPDFEIANLSGKSVRLTKILAKNKLVLVEFWAPWCAPCVAKFPTLKSLYSKYRDDGFEVVSISLLDSSLDDWEELSKQHDDLPWIDLRDESGFYGLSAIDYGVSVLPTNYVLDGDRLILAKNLDLDKLEQLLETQFAPSSEDE